MITAGVRTQIKHNRMIPQRPILSCMHPPPDVGNKSHSSYFCSDLNEMKPVLLLLPPLNLRSVPLRLSRFIFISATPRPRCPSRRCNGHSRLLPWNMLGNFIHSVSGGPLRAGHYCQNNNIQFEKNKTPTCTCAMLLPLWFNAVDSSENTVNCKCDAAINNIRSRVKSDGRKTWF